MSDILPIHPTTGLEAVGIVNGRPVWPIMGGSEDHDGGDGTEGGEGQGTNEEGSAESGESGSEGGEDTEDEGEGKEDQETIPAHVQKELDKARNEAAKYRVRAREAEKAAKESAGEEFAKQISELSDQKAAAVADLETAQLNTHKLNAALAAVVPEDMASVVGELSGLLQGNDPEEIQKHAEKVSKTLLGATKKTPATDPSQGAGGSSSKPDVGTGIHRIAHFYESKAK